MKLRKKHPTPARRPRFRIEKLEERIAPTPCHLNPQGKLVGAPRCFRPG